jgi:hypothetical protein
MLLILGPHDHKIYILANIFFYFVTWCITITHSMLDSDYVRSNYIMLCTAYATPVLCDKL